MPSFRPALMLRVHVPVEAETCRAVAQGDGAAVDRDPALAAMLAAIRADPLLGDFGLYRGVVEISAGLESFMPTDAARPVSGTAGDVSVSPTVILTTYIADDAEEGAVEAALDRIVAAHPWEMPVIELTATRLAGRGPAAG